MVDTKEKVFLLAYEHCHDAFLRYCSAITYGKMDTEDLVQDVLLTAYQNFENIQKKDQLFHYLIRAAKNRSISHWRKKKYKQELLDQHADRLISKEVSADTLLDIQLLYRTLDHLPEKQKDALILFEILGFSMKEIAVLQNSSEGAIKTKVSRGRQLLKKLLEEKDYRGQRLISSLKTILV